MNNKIIFGIIIIIIVIGTIFFLNRPNYQQSDVQQQTGQQSQTNNESNTIYIKDFAFNPGNLTIKQGTKVTWINQDTVTHKIKSDTFNSADLNQGDKFEYTFSDKGTFDYICGIHPSMTGKITVE